MASAPGMVDGQGNAYYFLRDGLGSVTGIVDAAGVLTATYSYDAYGNLRSATGALPSVVNVLPTQSREPAEDELSYEEPPGPEYS